MSNDRRYRTTLKIDLSTIGTYTSITRKKRGADEVLATNNDNDDDNDAHNKENNKKHCNSAYFVVTGLLSADNSSILSTSDVNLSTAKVNPDSMPVDVVNYGSAVSVTQSSTASGLTTSANSSTSSTSEVNSNAMQEDGVNYCTAVGVVQSSPNKYDLDDQEVSALTEGNSPTLMNELQPNTMRRDGGCDSFVARVARSSPKGGLSEDSSFDINSLISKLRGCTISKSSDLVDALDLSRSTMPVANIPANNIRSKSK